MADLTGTTPADTYKSLLQIGDATNGVDATAKYIEDGEGTDSALAISTTAVGIGTDNPKKILHIAQAVNGDSEVTLHNNDVTSGSSAQTKSLSFAFAQTGSAATRSVGAIIRAGKEQEWTSSSITQDGYISLQTAKGTTLQERMRIDSDGRCGIGTDNPSGKLEIEKDSYGTLDAGQGHLILDTVGVAREADKGPFINFRVPTTSSTSEDMANIGAVCSDSTANSRKADLVFWTRNNTISEKMRIDSDGNVTPGTDDAQDIGSSSKRWDDIYATNTTIQTSDRELKQDIEELTEAEERVAVACKGLLRKYRWKSSVAEKGDDARIHFGIMAQDLEAAFAAEGLDAGRYGMFIKNTWWEADRVIPAVEAVEAVEAQPERTERDIFDNVEDAPEGATEVTQRGVRYAELLAFIIAAI